MTRLTDYEQLTGIKTALAAIPGVSTCKIGLEPNITADDYPIIRIVPSVIRPRNGRDFRRSEMEIIVYYGELAQPFEAGGIEAQYQFLLDTERAIMAAISPGAGWSARWRETILDEDRQPGYKLFASRFVID